LTARPAGASKDKRPHLLFVAGHPVGHSLSPAMHNGVIARLRLPLHYVPVDVPPGRLEAFLRLVREANFLGGNVTIPFKEEAASLADTRSEAVAACGAANTLVAREGSLRAENTDGDGFLDALEGRGWGRRHRSAVLLGAGGAARGIAFALGRAGTRRITLLNRTAERSDAVVRALSAWSPGVTFSTGTLCPAAMGEAFREADLIVQCTSLGLLGDWEDFPYKAVKKSSCFADLVYRAGGTALVRKLRARGIPSMDGLPMLAHQAARSFALWTGETVPGAVFLRLAMKALRLW
jgi:shikimate dehydrogenase